jgi:hypothetical protein
MNVEIWTEVAQFLFGEYINPIFIAVQESEVFWTRDTRDTDSIRTALVTPIGAERLGRQPLLQESEAFWTRGTESHITTKAKANFEV